MEGYTCRHTGRWERFMKYAAEMGLVAIRWIQAFKG
jgi:hypothetical protein